MGSIELSFKSNSTYVFKRKIGTGGSADVFLYSRNTDGCPEQEVILKILKNETESCFSELINDGEKLNLLKHPNILRSFGYEKISGKKFALILEHIPGVTLKNIIEHIPVEQRFNIAAFLVKKILSALAAAHHADVIHGDVSAKNILISKEGDVKLADFGIAVKRGVSELGPQKGSIDYMSPDMWSGRCPSIESDLFSLGMIIYEILNGGHPFAGKSYKETRSALNSFLKEKPWSYWPQWNQFFSYAFEKSGSNKVPAVSIGDEKVVERLAACVFACENKNPKSLTETVTIAVSRFRSFMPGFFSFTVLAVIYGFLVIVPVATGGDVPLGHRLKSCALTVLSQPWGEVFIDEKSVGFTPLINLPVAAGHHRFAWRNFKGQIVRKSFIAFDNGMLNVRIKK